MRHIFGAINSDDGREKKPFMRIRIYAKTANQIRLYIPLIRVDVMIEGICVNDEEEGKAHRLFHDLTRGLESFLNADGENRMSNLSRLVSYIMEAINSFGEKEIPLIDRLVSVIEEIEQGGATDQTVLQRFGSLCNEVISAFCEYNNVISELPYPQEEADEDVWYVCLPYGECPKRNKTLRLNSLLFYYYLQSPERYQILQQFEKEDHENIQGITLGLSYIQRGLNTHRLKKKTACLAAPSQDLFYDYQMCQYACSKMKDLQFVIWGISPYSLWYDLSLSSAGSRAAYYYPQTHSLHHYQIDDTDLGILFQQLTVVAGEIFVPDFIQKSFAPLDGNVDYICNTQIYALKQDLQKDLETIHRLFDKDYPETYAENLEIIREMLLYLRNQKIKPYIVMLPYPSCFLQNMNQSMYDRTVEVLQAYKQEFPEMEFLNYTYDERFDDYYFADSHHLNYWGANMMADVLNEHLS